MREVIFPTPSPVSQRQRTLLPGEKMSRTRQMRGGDTGSPRVPRLVSVRFSSKNDTILRPGLRVTPRLAA